MVLSVLTRALLLYPTTQDLESSGLGEFHLERPVLIVVVASFKVASRVRGDHFLSSTRFVFLRVVVIALIFLLLPIGEIWADKIFKKDGTEVVGKIVAEEPERVLIEIQLGRMMAKQWVLRKDISRIERGLTPGEEFQDRLSRLKEHDLQGYQQLAAWAKKSGLGEEERYVLSLLPKVERAALMHKHPRTWCRPCSATGTVSCAPCEGDGESLIPCQRCAGAGHENCKICRGVAGLKVKCRKCAGEGSYQKFDPAKGRKIKTTCGTCRGKGEADCPYCKGEGVLECPSCEGSQGESSTCDVCQGKPEKTCSTCAGKKIQPTPVSAAELAEERRQAKIAKAKAELPKNPTGAGKESEQEKEEPVIKRNPFGGG